MKKSPLSMPSSSRQNQNCNWRVDDHKKWTGYNHVTSDSYVCMSTNEGKHTGDDFIPLNISTPLPERNRPCGNWRGTRSRNHRNSGSGGFNHYRNNYHSTPKTNFNNLYSPYKHSGKQFYGQKKGYQKDAHKQVDISSYIDMTSFLEDPWAELMKKFNDSKEVHREISPTLELPSSDSICIDPRLSSESQSVIDIDDSPFNLKSKTESSIDVALGLDDTDVSTMCKSESSIDLKLQNVRFGQELTNESKCSNNGSVCEDLEERNVHLSCDSTTAVIQDLV